MIYVAPSGIHGRGAFASEAASPGDVLDVQSVLLVPRDELPDALRHHVYEWDFHNVALCMGSGSFFNHDQDPSVEWELDYDNGTIAFRALSAVEAHEELTINYGEGHDWS